MAISTFIKVNIFLSIKGSFPKERIAEMQLLFIDSVVVVNTFKIIVLDQDYFPLDEDN